MGSGNLWVPLELGLRHGLSHVGTHGIPDAYKNHMGVLLLVCLLHGTLGSCVGSGSLKIPSVLPPGIRNQGEAVAGDL